MLVWVSIKEYLKTEVGFVVVVVVYSKGARCLQT